MNEYQTLALEGLLLVYVGSNIYFNKKRKNLITNFNNFANNYLPRKIKEVEGLFNEIQNNLEGKLKK